MKNYIEQVCKCGGRIAITCNDTNLLFACTKCDSIWDCGNLNIAPSLDIEFEKPAEWVDAEDVSLINFRKS